MQQAGAQSEAEMELAEQLRRRCPSLERLRFGLSGSEAVHAALRTARAATGRPLVAKFAGHYHGWLDPILTATSTCRRPRPRPAASSRRRSPTWSRWSGTTPPRSRRCSPSAAHELAAVITEAYPCNGGVIPAAPGLPRAAAGALRQRTGRCSCSTR